MLESIVILHGLFLLNCNSKSAPHCQILIANTPPHVYYVGVRPHLRPLDTDPDMHLTFDLPNTPGSPDRESLYAVMQSTLADRVLLLNPEAVTVVPTQARNIISLPVIPQGVWGMNRVRPGREDILNGTDGKVLLDTKNAVTVAETLVLSLGKRGHFTLKDASGKGVAKSEEVNGKAVLCIYSILESQHDGSHDDGFNAMLNGGTHPIKLKLTGIFAPIALDESASPAADMPTDIIRIPGTWKFIPKGAPRITKDRSGFEQPGVVRITTADKTGCGSVILSNF